MASVKTVPRTKRASLPMSAARKRLAYLLIAPAVIVAAALTVYPTVYMLYISFHRWSIMPTLPRPFIGFGQYAEIFSNPQFWNSLKVTGIFVLAAVSIELGLGFLAQLCYCMGSTAAYGCFAFLS